MAAADKFLAHNAVTMTGTLELELLPPGPALARARIVSFDPVQSSLGHFLAPALSARLSKDYMWQSGTKLYEIYRSVLMTTQRERGRERERERELNVCVGDMPGLLGLNTNIPAVTTTITLQLFHSHGQQLPTLTSAGKKKTAGVSLDWSVYQ